MPDQILDSARRYSLLLDAAKLAWRLTPWWRVFTRRRLAARVADLRERGLLLVRLSEQVEYLSEAAAR